MDVKVKVYKQVYSEMFRGDNLNCFLQSLPNDYFNGKLKAVCLSRDCVPSRRGRKDAICRICVVLLT